MARPVVGVIGNAYSVENRFTVQMAGERNFRAVANVAGALPLVFAGEPDITDIDDLLQVVDGILADRCARQCPSQPFSNRARPRLRAL